MGLSFTISLLAALGMAGALPLRHSKRNCFDFWPSARRAPLCDTIVIAERGASGYVPEHTLGAYALAITMGTDFVEPDLVITKDGQLIVRHENELSLTTDVSEHPEFADRRRTQTVDGIETTGWFTEDFTLEEIKTLRAIERMPDIRPGNARLDGAYKVPTFQEVIDLVQSLQQNRKKVVGIATTIRHSTHFRLLGLPMELPVVLTLLKNGYWRASDPAYIQSFEVTNLQLLKTMTNLKLVQLYLTKDSQPFDQKLLGSTLTYGDMATPEGLREVAKYAFAVGPDKNYIIPRDENNRLGSETTFVNDAHAADLEVYPYTFRAENYFLPAELQSADRSPTAYGNLEKEIQIYLDAGIDGFFADQPDIAIHARGECYSE